MVGTGPGQPDQYVHHVHRQLIARLHGPTRKPLAGRAARPRVRAALAPLLVDPGTTAILTDFDGTLSPIVANPDDARPLDGAAEVLALLAGRFGEVAVVSGRSVSFLDEHLALDRHRAAPRSTGSARFVGLYGLEWSRGDGRSSPSSRMPSRGERSIDDAVADLRRRAPAGVVVEPKGLAVTVHWRQVPTAEGWAVDAGGRRGRALRPPGPPGTHVDRAAPAPRRRQGLGGHAGWRRAARRPATSVTTSATSRRSPPWPPWRERGWPRGPVAVVDDESDPRVPAAADLTVPGRSGPWTPWPVGWPTACPRWPDARSCRSTGPGSGPRLTGPPSGLSGPRRAEPGASRPGWRAEISRWSRSALAARSSPDPCRAPRPGPRRCRRRRRGSPRARPEASSSKAPASRDRASTPLRELINGPSLATRLRPSRTGLTSRTS